MSAPRDPQPMTLPDFIAQFCDEHERKVTKRSFFGGDVEWVDHYNGLYHHDPANLPVPSDFEELFPYRNRKRRVWASTTNQTIIWYEKGMILVGVYSGTQNWEIEYHNIRLGTQL